ncbi:MAG: hypothetical protein ABL918_07400 [Chakrabartia sp.]
MDTNQMHQHRKPLVKAAIITIGINIFLFLVFGGLYSDSVTWVTLAFCNAWFFGFSAMIFTNADCRKFNNSEGVWKLMAGDDKSSRPFTEKMQKVAEVGLTIFGFLMLLSLYAGHRAHYGSI